MGVRRHYSGRVHKFAKRSALPEQEKGHLGVWKLSQGSKQLGCFVDALSGVSFAEGRTTDGAAQKGEALVAYDREGLVGGESVEVGSGVGTRGGDKLAFVWAEFQADRGAFGFKFRERVGYRLVVSGEAAVVEVRKNQMQACLGLASPSRNFAQDGLESQRKEEGA